MDRIVKTTTCASGANVLIRRREALTLLAAGLGLAACERAPGRLRGIDMTGSTYGRSFQLKDPQGKTRTLDEFRGKVVMIFFGFTQCPDVCPTALTRATEVRGLLGPHADRLQVIFVTLDPERDSAAILDEYTHAFDPVSSASIRTCRVPRLWRKSSW